MKKKIKMLFKNLIVIIYWKILYRAFTLLPIRDKVLFESFLGRSYSDSPKYIFRRLKQNDNKLKYVWSLKKIDSVEINDAIIVKRMSLKYLYELATSKYIITNSRMPLKWSKRKKQIYVQTWHGTPFKRLVYDMDNITLPLTNKELYLKNFSKDVAKWDYLVSPNKFSTNTFRGAFRYEGKILETGYPRNESLYNISDSKIEEIKEKLGIEKDCKVILYAPTFRDNNYISKGNYVQDFNIDTDKLTKTLGTSKYIFILRSHYLVNVINYKYNDNKVMNLSDYQNINDLYKISDLLITDYSSVFFDYMELKKPVIFYQYDQDEYNYDIRGFYLPLEDLPGEIITDEKELYKIIKMKLNNSTYNYESFINKYDLKVKDGENSSQIIIKTILDEKS